MSWHLIFLSDLTSNPNNLVGILFIRVVFSWFFDKILLMILKISNCSSSGSILINWQSSSYSIAFALLIS